MTQSLALTPFGLICFALFFIAYYFIAMEEKYHISKSKPALLVGTGLFLFIGIYEFTIGTLNNRLHEAFEHVVVEIAGIFFFLYAAMVYIEVLIERNVFEALKSKLVDKKLSYKKLFWSIGILTFFVSALADNLTTALIFGAVAATIAGSNKAFLVPTAVNIVVSANAGGAWSPFGDITTLMAWNAGKASFFEFFLLFPASFIGWFTTSYLLSLYIQDGSPQSENEEAKQIKEGGKFIVFLGLSTITISVVGHQFLHLPAIAGMMFGLALLMIYDHYLKKVGASHFGVFASISKIENDTLLFFFGLLCSVGALGYLGFLAYLGDFYTVLDPTIINVLIGFASAIIDNVPIMYAVLKADPAMAKEQWLLVTLTAGIGGSLIAFGSAAGVALMGKLKGVYTFSAHMKLSWTVLVGYIVSIAIWYLQFKL